jgi:hypothetical protein
MRWPELLALIVIVESIAAAVLEAQFGLSGGIPWAAYYIVWLSAGFVVGLVAYFVWLYRLFRADEDRPTKAMIGRLRSIPKRSFVEFLVPILVIPAFLASHTTFKALLPHLTTYDADPLLTLIDGVFGFQPWQLTHALFGPVATVVLDRLYLTWFFVSTATLFAVIFLPALAAHKGQVLLTFVICWIVLGAGLALLVPSVGPCFYGKIYPGVDPFEPLMTKLQLIQADGHYLNALRAQAKLWGDHASDTVGFGSGLSAMPSLHISIATITWLLLRQLRLGWLGLTWVVVIWIGSIHLGWHYASDGIVAVFITLLIWKLCGPGVAARLARESSRQLGAWTSRPRSGARAGG